MRALGSILKKLAPACARRGQLLLATILALNVQAQPPQPTAAEPFGTPDLHARRYQQAAANKREALVLDTDSSIAWVLVRRGGPLALFGHDHVVSSHALEGYLMQPGKEQPGRADIRVDLRRLVVDEPKMRMQLNLGAPPKDEAIAGTRRNMQQKVLESDRYPFLVLRLRNVTTDMLETGRLEGQLRLHGMIQPIQLTVQVDKRAGGLRLEGRFSIHQRRYGITPFTIMGGALQVRDRLEGGFTAIARPVQSAPE